MQCADIDVQPVANSCDVGGLLRLIRHNGACTNRQDGIRHIICGHIVGDVMHERCILSYIFQIAFQHDCFLLLHRFPSLFHPNHTQSALRGLPAQKERHPR